MDRQIKNIHHYPARRNRDVYSFLDDHIAMNDKNKKFSQEIYPAELKAILRKYKC